MCSGCLLLLISLYAQYCAYKYFIIQTENFCNYQASLYDHEMKFADSNAYRTKKIKISDEIRNIGDGDNASKCLIFFFLIQIYLVFSLAKWKRMQLPLILATARKKSTRMDLCNSIVCVCVLSLPLLLLKRRVFFQQSFFYLAIVSFVYFVAARHVFHFQSNVLGWSLPVLWRYYVMILSRFERISRNATFVRGILKAS